MEDMISLDISFFIQLANFIITIVVLNYLLIKPVREQISARNSLMASYGNEINGFTANAHEKLKTYEVALDEARTAAQKSREEVKTEAEAIERQIISTAQSNAQAFLSQSRSKVAAESKVATDALLSQVNSFADKAMKKILG